MFYNIISLIEKCFLCTFDELVMEYQPSAEVKAEAEQKGEPIPVTFIQRKPHPNGLLAYILATFLSHPKNPASKLPFIVDYFPHLKVDDIHTGNLLEKIIER